MNIEDEILRALADPADDGTRINDIADQFRRGRDVRELLILLDSSNAELASMGSWILGELRFELYNSEPILSRLRKLTDHDEPAVRFHASGALFPALNSQDATTQALLQKLLRDPNEGVRRAAVAAADRLSLK
jgi:hypothetical protein